MLFGENRKKTILYYIKAQSDILSRKTSKLHKAGLITSYEEQLFYYLFYGSSRIIESILNTESSPLSKLSDKEFGLKSNAMIAYRLTMLFLLHIHIHRLSKNDVLRNFADVDNSKLNLDLENLLELDHGNIKEVLKEIYYVSKTLDLIELFNVELEVISGKLIADSNSVHKLFEEPSVKLFFHLVMNFILIDLEEILSKNLSALNETV